MGAAVTKGFTSKPSWTIIANLAEEIHWSENVAAAGIEITSMSPISGAGAKANDHRTSDESFAVAFVVECC
jgi:hypothetical protein